MGRRHLRDEEVQARGGNVSKPFCRKTACYKVTLFIVGVLLVSLVISCVIVVVLRGERLTTSRVPVKVGNLEVQVKRHYNDLLVEYFNRIDVSRNGSLSLKSAFHHFKTMDKDNDDVLTTKEMTDWSRDDFRFIFEGEDFNSDGVILYGDVTDIHNRVDINDDDLVSQAEYILYHELARRALHDRESL